MANLDCSKKLSIGNFEYWDRKFHTFWIANLDVDRSQFLGIIQKLRPDWQLFGVSFCLMLFPNKLLDFPKPKIFNSEIDFILI